MGRPQGSKNRPGGKKPGRKPGATSLKGRYNDATILMFKVQILELLCSGQAGTISDAARQLGIDPARVHKWTQNDKDFEEMLAMTREVVADDLESEFRHHKNFIPKMMLLKGYRPMFRDAYKVTIKSGNLEKLLEELKSVKEPDAE